MPVVSFVRRAAVRRAGSTCLVLTACALAACTADTSPTASRELDGTAVHVGNGTAAAYVVERGSTPTSIGVRFSSTALDGLPASDSMWTLPLPTGVAAPPWDHVMLNWNAQGHPPGPYQVPHFDFHFYIISSSQQAAIQGGPDTTTVPAPNVPRDYFSGVMSVPDMGVHWIDSLAPELHGQPFDRTLIYGFYHGSMVFLEPMITRAFLASQPDVSGAVKQPQAYQTRGEYPLDWSVRYDAGAQAIRVSLDSLTSR